LSVLEGRAALFTGASGGAGADIANVLADEGAAVGNYLGSDPKGHGKVGARGVTRAETRPRGRRSLKGPG
jgi:NAD(P)-dependent dehydrogenase (short-subunit alcohol dehydrogenase family)